MSDRERRGPGKRRRRRLREKQGGEPRGGAPETSSPGRQGQRGQRRSSEREEAPRRGGRGGRRDGPGGEGHRSGREREPRLQFRSVILLPEESAASCAVCGKPVRDAVAALSYGEEHAPAHFDCVLEKLRAGRELRPDEQLCYLGGGNFGVVRFPRGEGKVPFSIAERIPYETVQQRPQWRRELDSLASRSGNAPSGQNAQGKSAGGQRRTGQGTTGQGTTGQGTTGQGTTGQGTTGQGTTGQGA